ncbi:MAG: hypothetical protein ABI151_12270 [Chitinophagaceae bacterium]
MVTLLFLHNLLRWILLFLLVAAIFRAYRGWKSRKIFGKSDRQVGLFLMISAHTELLIGIILWFTSSYGFQSIKNLGMGAVMKNSAARFWAVEHLTGMLIGVVLITIGRVVTKKPISDTSKFKRSFWFFLFGFLIIMSVVPWPGRKDVGRPLIPGATSSVSIPGGTLN